MLTKIIFLSTDEMSEEKPIPQQIEVKIKGLALAISFLSKDLSRIFYWAFGEFL
jgi:hypothetical protein